MSVLTLTIDRLTLTGLSLTAAQTQELPALLAAELQAALAGSTWAESLGPAAATAIQGLPVNLTAPTNERQLARGLARSIAQALAQSPAA
jgi:hypothetical protein